MDWVPPVSGSIVQYVVILPLLCGAKEIFIYQRKPKHRMVKIWPKIIVIEDSQNGSHKIPVAVTFPHFCKIFFYTVNILNFKNFQNKILFNFFTSNIYENFHFSFHFYHPPFLVIMMNTKQRSFKYVVKTHHQLPKRISSSFF